MRTEFRAFVADCENCGHRFMRPELGDMSYGEFLFATPNPPRYVYCNAFEAGPQLIHELMGDAAPDCFQSALAYFADGSPVANSLKCPSCDRSSLSRGVDGVGQSIDIPTTTYSRILALSREQLAAEIVTFMAEWRG